MKDLIKKVLIEHSGKTLPIEKIIVLCKGFAYSELDFGDHVEQPGDDYTVGLYQTPEDLTPYIDAPYILIDFYFGEHSSERNFYLVYENGVIREATDEEDDALRDWDDEFEFLTQESVADIGYKGMDSEDEYDDQANYQEQPEEDHTVQRMERLVFGYLDANYEITREPDYIDEVDGFDGVLFWDKGELDKPKEDALATPPSDIADDVASNFGITQEEAIEWLESWVSNKKASYEKEN